MHDPRGPDGIDEAIAVIAVAGAASDAKPRVSVAAIVDVLILGVVKGVKHNVLSNCA